MLLRDQAIDGDLDGGLTRKLRNKSEIQEGPRMALWVLGRPVCSILSLITFSCDLWLLQLHVIDLLPLTQVKEASDTFPSYRVTSAVVSGYPCFLGMCG